MGLALPIHCVYGRIVRLWPHISPTASLEFQNRLVFLSRRTQNALAVTHTYDPYTTAPRKLLCAFAPQAGNISRPTSQTSRILPRVRTAARAKYRKLLRRGPHYNAISIDIPNPIGKWRCRHERRRSSLPRICAKLIKKR